MPRKVYTLMRYYGSKRRMVSIIDSCLPNDYCIWVEGCLGSGAVSINIDKPASCEKSILNEKDYSLFQFWKVLADKEDGLKLIEQLLEEKRTETVFQNAHWKMKYPPRGITRVEYAKYTFLEIMLSYNGSRRNWGKQLSRDFCSKITRDFRYVYDRFQSEKVEICNDDILHLLERISGLPEEEQKGYMVYLDPPYLPILRAKNSIKQYKCEMTYGEHIKMLSLLQKVKCRVLLSGYFSEKYDIYSEMLLPYGYQCYFAMELKKTCSKSADTEMGKEYLWCNYELPEGAMVQKQEYTCLAMVA